MKHTIIILIFISSLLLLACSSGPQPIAYGNDQCAYCQMTIVDQQYGSELVTETGKVFKFDAVECMINHCQKELDGKQKVDLHLITSFTSPGELTDATAAHYLVSDQLPSPMGMNITAFADKATAEKFQKDHHGNLYQWKDLVDNFSNLSPGQHHMH